MKIARINRHIARPQATMPGIWGIESNRRKTVYCLYIGVRGR